MKEEGQVLIHTANTWGEKTMTNTATEGREIIRQELQQLQADWEQMLSHVCICSTAVFCCCCLFLVFFFGGVYVLFSFFLEGDLFK